MVVFKEVVNQTNKILFVSKDGLLDLASIRSGDLISVRFVRLESEREMEMNFLGLCINKTSKGFILRNIISGVIVDQKFSYLSPLVRSVVIVKYNFNLLKTKRAQFNNISKVSASLVKFNFSFSIKPFLVSQNLLKSFFTQNKIVTTGSYYIL